MAKNIEMNYKGDGGYEVLYPKNVSDISLASQDLQNLFSLSNGDSIDQAFNRINNLIQLNSYKKALIDITVKTTSGNPLEGIPISGMNLNIDGSGNVVTNNQGKATGYVSEGQVSIMTPSYVDLAKGTWSENFVAGKTYSHTFSLSTTSGIITYRASISNLQFSPNVSQIGITAVGGGGGGGGGYYSYKSEEMTGGGGGGGGGYCTVNDNVSFVPNTIYNLVVGSGGERGDGNSGSSSAASGANGGNGGVSSFLNVRANGGSGGERGYEDGPRGGGGNGKGGQGYDSRYGHEQEAGDGLDGKVLGYDNSGNKTIRYGGGGGGAGYTPGVGGASYGGDGGRNNDNAESGSANTGGGGGGGGGLSESGAGGSGVIKLKISLKVS